MDTNANQSERVLSALSYFSVFFAPIIFPIFVWILADKPISTHAKRSLVYHIVPSILLIIGTAIFSYSESISSGFLAVILIIIATLACLAAFYYIIYNILCGIKVLMKG